ncbi:hypothetical protein MMC21_001464 [Puttea exsequens]|nr:hypothetical protein [Puttea exsequens]
MDFLQDYLPLAARYYHDYYYPYQQYLYPIYRFLLRTQSIFFRHVYPFLYPLYTLSNRALQSLSSDSPDILSLLALSFLVIISVRIFDYMRRWIISWFAFAIRVGMWLAVGLVGIYVYNRGVEQSVEDFGYIWGLLEGLGQEGQRAGGRKAAGRERDARRMAGGAGRRRTRGGW